MSLRPAKNLFDPRGHVLASAPATEPVTAAELRTALVETSTALPDTEAELLIEEARALIEENTGLALVTQSWTLALDRWPNKVSGEWWDGIRDGAMSELHGGTADVILPRYPLQSITSCNVYDEGGTAAAVTVASVFDVDTYRRPGRMTLKRGATWPVALRASNAIVIEYVAGYGDNASDVPAPLRRAVKSAAGYLYTHRGDDCTPADALAGVAGILAQYRVVRL